MSINSNSFADQVVIITGASAGVGAACARAFAQHGAKLVLVARGEAALHKMAAELESQTEVLSVAMDVADSEACTAMLDSAKERFGHRSIFRCRRNSPARPKGDGAAPVLGVKALEAYSAGR